MMRAQQQIEFERQPLLSLLKGVKRFKDFEQKLKKEPLSQQKALFRQFVQAYLAINPIYQIQSIYALPQAPTRLIKRLGINQSASSFENMGLFETVSGNIHLYHVDYHPSSRQVTKRIADSFFELHYPVYGKVIITNVQDIESSQIGMNGCYAIRRSDLFTLTTTDFNNMKCWLQDLPLIRHQLTPMSHQKEAIKRLFKEFKQTDRLTLTMACGTGKSLIPLWLAEKLGYRRVIIFLPTLTLLQQFLHVWLKATSWQNFSCLAVCSDQTVTTITEDKWSIQPGEVDFPVTTNWRKVKQFLAKTPHGIQLIFCTYQSAGVVGKGAEKYTFDLGVFDEAHKTAGLNKSFNYSLMNEHIKISKRLFMTATPRHVSLRKRDEEEGRVIYSMNNPDIYGQRIAHLPFAKAVERQIICPYQIIISVITQKDINRVTLQTAKVEYGARKIPAQELAMLLALKQALQQYDIRKVLTFHHTIKQAKTFATRLAHFLSEYKIFHVNGELSSGTRHAMLDKFSAADRAILTNARCLTEGIDLPVIDMVGFMSTRRSKIDIVQAAGRAMRKAESKYTGYIFVPVFLQKNINETVEQAFERSDFEDVLTVLQAMSEEDEELASFIREAKMNQGQGVHPSESGSRKYLRIMGTAELNLSTLEKAITTYCIKYVGSTWDENFGELLAFKKKYGHCNVPQRYSENPKLGRWVNAQRDSYKKSLLSSAKTERLESIDFVWLPHDSFWDKKYKELVDFKNKYGHCSVPREYVENAQLAMWVRSQRQCYKKKTLSSDKIQRLEAIGFVWTPYDSLWEEGYRELVAFKKQYKHCNVPKKYVKNKRLPNWIMIQRQNYKRGILSSDRIQCLEAIGFSWILHDSLWEERYKELIDFKNKYGHCNVPTKFAKNEKLARWASTQRKNYKKEALSLDKIQRLEAIGFTWNVSDPAPTLLPN